MSNNITPTGIGLGKTFIGERLSLKRLLRPPVIDELLRRGETCNVIAESKVGKSWAVLSLAICVATGTKWLDRFRTTRGKVLILDNELHDETFDDRFRKLLDALCIERSEVDDRIAIENLRGNLRDLNKLAKEILRDIQPGDFDLIILDALYRLLPEGCNENDSANMARLYNTLDQIAQLTGAAIVVIHHSSKGDQGGKRITDVGAGAGAISRAPDSHLVFRQHEMPGAVIVEAATRSWRRLEPFCLRWEFPLWLLDETLDPTAIKRETNGRRGGKPKEARAAANGTVKDKMDAERFADQFITDEPRPTKLIESYAAAAGLTVREVPALLDEVRRKSLAFFQPKRGTKAALYSKKPFPVPEEPHEEAAAQVSTTKSLGTPITN